MIVNLPEETQAARIALAVRIRELLELYGDVRHASAYGDRSGIAPSVGVSLELRDDRNFHISVSQVGEGPRTFRDAICLATLEANGYVHVCCGSVDHADSDEQHRCGCCGTRWPIPPDGGAVPEHTTDLDEARFHFSAATNHATQQERGEALLELYRDGDPAEPPLRGNREETALVMASVLRDLNAVLDREDFRVADLLDYVIDDLERA